MHLRGHLVFSGPSQVTELSGRYKEIPGCFNSFYLFFFFLADWDQPRALKFPLQLPSSQGAPWVCCPVCTRKATGQLFSQGKQGLCAKCNWRAQGIASSCLWARWLTCHWAPEKALAWWSLTVRAEFWANISPNPDPSSHFPQSLLISTFVSNRTEQAWVRVTLFLPWHQRQRECIKSECFPRMS